MSRTTFLENHFFDIGILDSDNPVLLKQSPCHADGLAKRRTFSSRYQHDGIKQRASCLCQAAPKVIVPTFFTHP